VRLPQRWPLHPQPSEGESLSSWLSRVARCYRMGLQNLLEHDLGHGRLDDLDMAPPAALWDTLERRSGLAPERLRSMTLAGLTPWLLDGVDPDPDSGAYDLYVGQLSVLLPAGPRPSRVVPGWRAWVPRQPILRACPWCLEVSGNQVLLLQWQLPVSVGCPAHGCRLETYGGTPGNFLGWASEDTQPRAVPDVCAAMDRRTWHAFTHGYVDLPRRRVHAGVWFRLLRSLVEDVLAPRSQHRAQGPDLCLIWERSGHPVRAGLGAWRPYESLDISLQLRALEAAATAIDMIETGQIVGRGTEAALLLPEPLAPIADDWQPPVSCWRRVSDAAEEVISQARHDPEAAQGLFRAILFGRTDTDSMRQVRKLLLDVGIPPEHLSQ
jgi:TniQ